MSDAYSPFDFINSVSLTKKDLIRDNEDLSIEEAEKQYVPYIVNKGLSYFPETILHVNELNRLHGLPKDAQYRYFLGALRPAKRFSKWHKADKSADLDLIQEMMVCNRTVAKQYLKVLTKEQLTAMHTSRDTGGASCKKAAGK